ncbi:MAG: TIM barrel protein [Verrucomicrobiia bacterium]
MTLRQKKVVPLWDRVHECLSSIIPYAKNKKIKLGIENRAYFGELPFEEEFTTLWNRYPSDTLVYWHDFGHAQLKQERSWLNHWETFSQQKNHLGGCHIHDARFPSQDHQALGKGNIEWPLFLSQLATTIPWVLEFHPKTSEDHIQKSLNILKNFQIQ